MRRASRGWPTLCAVCQGWALQRLCGECVARHAIARPRCLGCGLVLPAPAGAADPAPPPRCGRCLLEPLPLDRVVTAVDYAYPWRQLIGRLKYRDGLDLAAPLARVLATRLREAAWPEGVQLVPLPLTPAREQQRGYNQAARLASALGRELGLPVVHDLLERWRDAPPQAALDRADRLRNLEGAYALARPPAARRPAANLERAAGARIALIDDVMTTGASVSAAARSLRQAGAAHVEAWVVARTPEA